LYTEGCKEMVVSFYQLKIEKSTSFSEMDDQFFSGSSKELTVPFFPLYEVESSNEIKNLLNRALYRKEIIQEVKNELFNQDEAVNAVFESLKVYMAGLKDDDKPIGSYLLTGPTGVGKTELAEILQSKLGFELIRINMSEYQSEHEVSKLIGAPPGYAGHQTKPFLEDKIGTDQKRCIVLFDEMDKAHPKLQHTFLQIMDKATLTLGNGTVLDFSNSLILYAANLGVVVQNRISLSNESELLRVDESVIKRHFSPEFLGRLTGILKFNPLTEAVCEQILNKFLNKLRTNLLEPKGFHLEIDKNTKKWLLEKGFDKMYGARPLRHVLDKTLKPKIADLILNSEHQSGKVRTHLKNGSIELLMSHK